MKEERDEPRSFIVKYDVPFAGSWDSRDKPDCDRTDNRHRRRFVSESVQPDTANRNEWLVRADRDAEWCIPFRLYENDSRFHGK